MLPSAENETDQTERVCPSAVASRWPSATRCRSIDPVLPPIAIVCPSGANARDVVLELVGKHSRKAPVHGFQRVTVLSPIALASTSSVGENARLHTVLPRGGRLRFKVPVRAFQTRIVPSDPPLARRSPCRENASEYTKPHAGRAPEDR